MKKYLKLLTTLLILLFAFTSCDNDATNGILSNIVNAETQEEYQIKAVTANNANSIIYSVEADGIYKTDTTTNTDNRTRILDSTAYPNISSIYYDETNIYFDYYDTTAKKNVLAYFNPTTPTSVNTINVGGTLRELTSNGFVVAKDTDYYVKNISNSTADITKADFGSTTFATASDSLSDTIVINDSEILLQTVTETSTDDVYDYDYWIFDGSSLSPSGVTSSKIISAVKNTADNYYFVLADASLYEKDSSSVKYENEDTDYSFNNESQKIFIDDQYLIVFDSSNYVLAYDLDDPTTSFDSLTEGFANVLRNTTDIVGIFTVSDTAPFKYYVATNDNGYYTLTIDNLSAISDDDGDLSSCESDFQ